MPLISIDKNPPIRQLRQFACFFFPVFLGIAAYLFHRKTGDGLLPSILYLIAGVSMLIGVAKPTLIKPLFLALMYITFPIGWVVSHILLLIAYYLVLTPIGLLLRLFGHDPMQRKFDRTKSSYWIPRDQNKNTNSYFKQY